MMHSFLSFRMIVMMSSKNSSSKLKKLNRRLNNFWKKSMKKLPSEMLNRRKLMINTNSDPSYRTSSSISTTERL